MVKWGAEAIPTTNILLLAHLFRIAHLQVIKLKRTFIFHNMNSFVHGMWCRFGVLRSLALPSCYPILSIFRFRLHTRDATTAAPVPHTSHDLKIYSNQTMIARKKKHNNTSCYSKNQSCRVYPLRSASIILPLHCLTKPILAYYYYLLAGMSERANGVSRVCILRKRPCTYLDRVERRTP